MPVAHTGESAPAIRAALVEHFARFLQPLRTAPTYAELTAWVSPLSSLQLVACLGRTPNEAADRLAASLGTAAAIATPAEAIADTVLTEYPDLSEEHRADLVKLTKAVREASIDGDGSITATDLYSRGCGSSMVARFMPAATHVLNVIGGSTPPRTADSAHSEAPADERLRDAGVRASVRAALS